MVKKYRTKWWQFWLPKERIGPSHMKPEDVAFFTEVFKKPLVWSGVSLEHKTMNPWGEIFDTLTKASGELDKAIRYLEKSYRRKA